MAHRARASRLPPVGELAEPSQVTYVLDFALKQALAHGTLASMLIEAVDLSDPAQIMRGALTQPDWGLDIMLREALAVPDPCAPAAKPKRRVVKRKVAGKPESVGKLMGQALGMLVTAGGHGEGTPLTSSTDMGESLSGSGGSSSRDSAGRGAPRGGSAAPARRPARPAGRSVPAPKNTLAQEAAARRRRQPPGRPSPKMAPPEMTPQCRHTVRSIPSPQLAPPEITPQSRQTIPSPQLAPPEFTPQNRVGRGPAMSVAPPRDQRWPARRSSGSMERDYEAANYAGGGQNLGRFGFIRNSVPVRAGRYEEPRSQSGARGGHHQAEHHGGGGGNISVYGALCRIRESIGTSSGRPWNRAALSRSRARE